jgi:hypothetical protein
MKVVIRLIEPILPRRAKDIHVERVFQRQSLVANVRGDVQYLAGEHIDYL